MSTLESPPRAEAAPELASVARPADIALPAQLAKTSRARGKVVIVSEHDYRTARRANMHPIADALVNLGHDVSFISVRFSPLSLWKGDSRNFLWDRANAVERHGNIRCYLWKTPFHPFHPRIPALDALAAPLYWIYRQLPNRFIDEEFRSADWIIVESGLGALLLARAKAANAAAKFVYLASDELVTVGVHPYVQRQLEKACAVVDQVCLPARQMAANFRWAGERLFFVPHGINPADFAAADDNPYSAAVNAVSVGSMLFDPDVFRSAAERFPNIQFHVIGAGAEFDAPVNVHLYPEMAFRRTIPFIKHATFGIAPYRCAPGCEYIGETSMKLMQYEYLGIPAVCPGFAVAGNPNRFGYTPGDAISLEAAIAAALQQRGKITPPRVLRWEEVAQRLLAPQAFADTRL